MPSPVLSALYEGRRAEADALAAEPDVLEAAALGRLDALRTHLEGDPDALAARTLLEAGADPNVRQQGGYTPLLSAAHADDPELARLLLEHGADRTAAADDGRDPLAMAGPLVRPLLEG